jgi:DNA-binding GntR family transcriptional regulator
MTFQEGHPSFCYLKFLFTRMSIATYIKEDLAAQMKSGQALDVPLTLVSLAEHNHVSLTPVRKAVASLINEGLLEKASNHRLVAVAPSLNQTVKQSRQELPEPPRDPYEIIASDLVRLSLQGQPVYLREEATAEKYDVSRSAIRNVMHRLAGEGVLDHIPRRDWKLRPFRRDDLQAFTQVREALELKALELAQPKLDDNELRHILTLNVAPSSDKTPVIVDESLHAYLIHAAGNAYIKDFFDRQSRYYRLLFEWEDHDQAVAEETMRQHSEVLKALLSKNWSPARKALSHHILDNHPILGKLRGIPAALKNF